MKKYIIALLVFLFLSINMQAQSVDFDPDHGQEFVCSGTNSQAAVSIYWSCQETPYPSITVASYVELTAEGQTYASNWHNTNIGNNIPSSMLLSSGTHTWTIKLYERFLGLNYFQKTAETTHTFYVKYTMYAANNFSGGSINLEGSTVTAGTSSASVKKMVGQSVAVGAIDQNDGNGYSRIWNTNGTNNSNWLKNFSTPILGATSRNYSYTVASGDNGISLVADLKKICNLSFINNYSTIYLNGSSQSSPASANVVEQNTISVSGNSYSSNGLIGTFSHWVKEGQTFSSSITPTAHGTYTAVYTHKPSNSGENVTSSSPVGSPVTITWTDNVNTAVNQYQIWRTVKHNGVNGNPQLLATVGRGVQSYTDYEYVKTSSYVDLLQYDVRAYYSTEGTYADASWYAVYGEMGLAKKNESELTTAAAKELPKEYAISNHPNPFNPTTTISYQLPEAGMVTIKVYDILGKEVAELVNESKQAGYYTVNFDAGRLTSGIYISTIQSDNFIQSKKMLLIK